ncbi:MAG: hypothetical protein ACE5EA_06315 [Nitrospirota bacterium]
MLGTSHDMSEFAVDTIELWLKLHGWRQYPNLKDLIILCDSGGSNGCRARGWKYNLYHKISNPYGISVTVCHYPQVTQNGIRFNIVCSALSTSIGQEYRFNPVT